MGPTEERVVTAQEGQVLLLLHSERLLRLLVVLAGLFLGAVVIAVEVVVVRLTEQVAQVVQFLLLAGKPAAEDGEELGARIQPLPVLLAAVGFMRVGLLLRLTACQGVAEVSLLALELLIPPLVGTVAQVLPLVEKGR